VTQRMRFAAGTLMAAATVLAGVAPVSHADPGAEEDFAITSDVPTLEEPLPKG
jgi:hypothetical protein